MKSADGPYRCVHEVQTGPEQWVCEADPCMCLTLCPKLRERVERDLQIMRLQNMVTGTEPDDLDGLMIALADLYGGEGR